MAFALEPSSFPLSAEHLGGEGPRYERRRTELSTLHQVVRENLETLYAAVEQGFASPLPDFVRRELEGFLECGLWCRGFAMLACESCSERRMVTFSCKGRGFCPSCAGRRMAQVAANLVDHILPRVALRQFVLTVPFELRARLAYDGKLCGAVCRIFVDSVLGFYQRRMRELDPSLPRGKSGAVTVVQRLNMDLRLNPHFHALLLDGVYVAGENGELRFYPLPELSSADVADLLQVVRVRILRFLERRGVIESASAELTVLHHDLCEREPALAQLAAASVSGVTPAGPERRARPPITLSLGGGIAITAPLTVSEFGFSLHAATTVDADDEPGREALCRYLLRPPLAHEHLERLSDELVRIHLRHPFADGTTAVDLDPLSLLVRLATSVPPPLFNTIRYGGVLAPAASWRGLVVPPPPQPAPDSPEDADDRSPPSKPPTHRSGWRPWQELMMRCFSVDVMACQRCNGRMKLIALVTRPESIRRLLQHLGEPTEAPPRTPARDPPFFKSHVVRRRLGHDPRSTQLDMFATT